MKKITCFFMAVILSLSFCSCAKPDNKNDINTQSKTPTQNIQIPSEKNETSMSETSQIQSNEFENVVITLENYKEYFELKEHFYAYKDEFGDYIDSMTYGVYLCLKEEYEADTGYTDDKSNVKVKFEATNSWYGFDFDENSGEGKRLERINAYNDVYTKTETFVGPSKEEGFEDLTYAAKIYSGSVSVWPYDKGGFGEKYKYSVDYPENINITGITGTLYVKRK